MLFFNGKADYFALIGKSNINPLFFYSSFILFECREIMPAGIYPSVFGENVMRKILTLCFLLWQANFAWAESIKESAEQGNALAQAKLASLYLLGREGFDKDEQKAAEWMEKAANQGVVDAQVIMGAMYDRGLGVTGDRDKATRWYEKAAAQGHGTSLAILGKNEAAQGSVQFNYQAMRLSAARSIPTEYAKKFLTTK
ncbi:tetratricopeptide repeat protein [Methylomonas montana]|uniref:tetratricopeptide repeat protein n=1 Tax=Methylomonas montana TaxID=3058963 RepID=UPI002658AF13|nr:tetratricopeptide repeat protein [Methylomonas montana]WKJ92056.1 tetratricopeptide repeat protein [Methylomonas montana]